ncbi:MAG: FAD:protein FMN transferase [Acidobacteriota bacterium]|nr:FAD:protein FMN transferase [Acidobacteriota bacterium]
MLKTGWDRWSWRGGVLALGLVGVVWAGLVGAHPAEGGGEKSAKESAEESAPHTVKEVQIKMGSRFEVTVVHEDAAMAREAVAAAYGEIDRIEALISSWRESSETSRVNRAAGQGAVAVSPELFDLVRRSLKVSKLTDGAFDITFAGAGKLWDFKAEDPKLPAPEAVATALELVDYRLLRLDAEQHTLELPREGMAIGFGGIGKGYAANRAVEVLRGYGAAGGVVNAGGDLLAFGEREDGTPWTVAITDPLQPDEVFAYLRISGQAVVTSGDYERYVEIDGVRYAHILDPRTGQPVRDVRSVTIVCPNAELADALATGVFVLGREKGLALLNQLRGIEGMIVDAEGSLHFSDNLQSKFVREETDS